MSRLGQIDASLSEYQKQKVQIEKNEDCKYDPMVWKNPKFFQEYIEVKGKNGKGKRENLAYSSDISCNLPIEFLLEIFMNQSIHTWKNSSIISEGRRLSASLAIAGVLNTELFINDMQNHFLEKQLKTFIDELSVKD